MRDVNKFKGNKLMALVSSVFFLLVSLIVWGGSGKSMAVTADGNKPSILIVMNPRVSAIFIDPIYRNKLEGVGYTIGTSYYKELTWEKMTKYNLVLMATVPPEPHHKVKGTAAESDEAKNFKMFQEKKDLIYKYVKEGGGLLFLTEVSDYYAPQKYIDGINSFLKPLGAEVLQEGVIDNEHIYRQEEWLQIKFCYTDNIKKHPITQGVNLLWYPAASFTPLDTIPLKVNDAWKVIVKGTKSAYSTSDDIRSNISSKPSTYSSAPPICAVREYGKGRIVLFSSSDIFWLRGVYRLAMEGRTLDKGDGFSFMTNIYNWLAQPSLLAGNFGGAQTQKEETEPITCHTNRLTPQDQRPRKNVYVGVIGVHSTYSGGKYTVKEFCDKAKELGYNYLVFTEKYMPKETWDKFAVECASQSTTDFLAIPGYEFVDEGGNSGLVFNIHAVNKWPAEQKVKKIGYQICFLYNPWPTVTLTSPNFNSVSPWFLKFYNAFEVYAYKGSVLIDNALQLYKDLQASYYELTPLVCHRIYDPEELKGLKGYKTYVLADSVGDIPLAFNFFPKTLEDTFVSNGPLIHDFRLEGEGLWQDMWELYYLWETGEKVNIHIDVSSEYPIKEIILYKRKDIFRRFRPNQKRFTAIIPEIMEQDGPFLMTVTDSRGREAVSSALITRHNIRWVAMCGDMQNTMDGLAVPDKNGSSIIRGERRKSSAIFAGVTGGGQESFYSLVPAEDLVIEWDVGTGGISNINALPTFLSQEVLSQEVFKNLFVKREFQFASGDCSILDNIHVRISKNPAIESTARFISFTPRLYSYNMMIIDMDTKVKRDIRLKDENGLEVRLIGPGRGFFPDPKAYPNYSYIGKDGLKHSGKRTISGGFTISSAELGERGYVALWPSMVGSLAVFPFQKKDYDFAITGGSPNIVIGYNKPNEIIPAGTVWHDRFLLVIDNGATGDDSAFDKIRDIYGFDGEPVYKVSLTNGEVLDDVYALTLQAKDYYVAGAISKADLPNELGIIVKGINSNWDAGVYDKETKKLKRVGVFENTAYLTLDTTKKKDFFIGNLLTCDNTEIKLTLLKADKDIVEFEAHNPTDKEVGIRIRSPKEIETILRIDKETTLKPGESKHIRVF